MNAPSGMATEARRRHIMRKSKTSSSHIAQYVHTDDAVNEEVNANDSLHATLNWAGFAQR